MYFSALLVALSGFGFSVSISPANTWDNMIDAVQYYNAPENRIYPCYALQTKELQLINVCQTGIKSANIVVSVK